MQQLTISLDRSLTQQFPNFMDVIRASVYDCGRPFKGIAADLDMSVSELSRRLAPEGDIALLLKNLPELIRATGDKRPVSWLVESFFIDDETKQKRVVDELSKMLPQLHELLKQVRG